MSFIKNIFNQSSNVIHKKLFVKFYTAIALLICTSCSIFGIQNIEQASYKIKLEENQYQIRNYDSLLVASTEVSEEDFNKSNKIAFRRLASYIFGKNDASSKISMTAPVLLDKKKGQKIAMTAPVLLNKKDEVRTMSFVLPKKYNLKTLPKPIDDKITIKKYPEKQIAAITFSGFFNEKRFEQNSTKLRKWLESKGYKAISSSTYAGYNPPWTIPFFKRNEVLIEVKKQ